MRWEKSVSTPPCAGTTGFPCCWSPATRPFAGIPELLGENLPTVAVKRGLSRYSARQIPPVRARQMIEDGTRQALQDLPNINPYVPTAPTKITIELDTVDNASHHRGRQGVSFPDPLTVVSEGRDWMEAWNQIWAGSCRPTRFSHTDLRTRTVSATVRHAYNCSIRLRMKRRSERARSTTVSTGSPPYSLCMVTGPSNPWPFSVARVVFQSPNPVPRRTTSTSHRLSPSGSAAHVRGP